MPALAELLCADLGSACTGGGAAAVSPSEALAASLAGDETPLPLFVSAADDSPPLQPALAVLAMAAGAAFLNPRQIRFIAWVKALHLASG